MRGVFIILDGLGDRACRLLNGLTPLQAAKTPNLDWFAERSRLGLHFHPEKEIPQSDKATLSILGNETMEIRRGVIEAVGAGVKMSEGNVAFRADFASIDFKSGRIIDRRVGRTLNTHEGRELADAINRDVKMPFKFIFKSTVQHRGVLVFLGDLSGNISDTDPEYTSGGDFALPAHSTDHLPLSTHTAHLTNHFLKLCSNVLRNHRVNKERIKRGLLPANALLLRGAGNSTPPLKKYDGWISVNYMPVERGIAILSGMKTLSFKYPDFYGLDVYKNLHEGLKQACSFSAKILEENKRNPFFYIHIKETDIPGHDGDPYEKKKMIEEVDELLISRLRKMAEHQNFRILLTGDHATPCEDKGHSRDPVPFLFYNKSDERLKKGQRFNEISCSKNSKSGIESVKLLRALNFY